MEIKRKIKQEVKDRRSDFNDRVRKLKDSNKGIVSPQVEDDNAFNVAEFYQRLTPTQKEAFDKQLKFKKIRNNYAEYVKYVYGDNYLMTRFHSLLCKLAQSVITKMEHGERVRLCISIPPQCGKGYPVDFPVLTTKGWKRHGDLQVGDYVYNDKGEQVAVLGNQKPYMWHCLEITFATGEKHIITREHLWKVFLEKENRISGIHKNIRQEHIIETQELMNILSKQRRKPYVQMNSPLQNENKDLTIDPYILGLWLGDGISACNEIVVSDIDLSDELVGIGDKEKYCIIKRKNNPSVSYIKLGTRTRHYGKCRYAWDFTKKLHDIDVLNNKHIPVEYLLSSEEQRWELLRGLMDTDGCVDKKGGSCEYCGTNKQLCYDVFTLLRSLGIKAVIKESDAKLYGRIVSKKYRISFTADKGQKIFNINRKQKRIDNKVKQDRKDKYEYFITSIKPVDDMLVSCISVDGGMYLAGTGLIPTHNSKTLTETLPSWFIGRHPNGNVILTGYNSDIAVKFGDNNRNLIKEFGKEIFDIEPSESMDRKDEFGIKGYQGKIVSRGLLGGLTSNAANLLIIDDPFKNGEEANNPDIREKVWRVFCDSAMTRVHGSLECKGDAVIVIHTRWHEDDLIGRLSREEGWIVVNIPCVWEDGTRKDTLLGRKVGETLLPELGFDYDWACKTRKLLGERVWSALYQGKPFIDTGNLIKRENIRIYNKNSKPYTFEEITMSCDLTFGANTKNSDPYCISIWGRNGADHYLLDVVSKKASFMATLEIIKVLSAKYPTMRKKLIEKKANGQATIEMLNSHIGCMIPFTPTSSKEDRFNAVCPYFEAGNVFFPDQSIQPDIEFYINQLLKFPNGEHDDFVDTVSQYLLNYQYKYGGKVQTNSGLALLSKALRGIKL